MNGDMSTDIENNALSSLVGWLIVHGIDSSIKSHARGYIGRGGNHTEFAQAIINAKKGKEKQTAREALRMILIDLNFVEVENVRL